MRESTAPASGGDFAICHAVRAVVWVRVLWVAIGLLIGAPCFAQSLPGELPPSQSQQSSTNTASPAADATLQTETAGQVGSVAGTVVDQQGALIANVKITLTTADGEPKKETQSDDAGHFDFSDVAAGAFQLSVRAAGFAPLEKSGSLNAGESYVFPPIALAIARNDVDVEVMLPQEQVAEDEIKAEEKQRLLGVFPNFYVSYVPNAVPLTKKQKFELAWKSTIDPVSFAVTGAVAGIEQAEDLYDGFGTGAEGYAKRYGAAYADLVSGTFIGGAILPSLLKQDPRYFYKGTGTTKSRFLYALANSVICKGDNRRWQPNYSFIIGGLAAGGISNLYYPAQNRNGAALTFENALIGIGSGALSNVIQEFFLKKLTPHVPAQGAGNP
ncbi:MAG: carboxypeptidase-like regulatory domain-containing protein [Candidatus Sulfotelmatobacter sp.]